MTDRLNPRDSGNYIANHSQHVTINNNSISKVAKLVSLLQIEIISFDIFR